MLENSVEEKLKKEVKKIGGKAFKFESSGNDGVPDRIVILPGGRIYFVELKRPKGGRFRKLQKWQMEQLEQLGCNVKKINSYEEVEKFIKEVQEVKKDEV